MIRLLLALLILSRSRHRLTGKVFLSPSGDSPSQTVLSTDLHYPLQLFGMNRFTASDSNQEKAEADRRLPAELSAGVSADMQIRQQRFEEAPESGHSHLSGRPGRHGRLKLERLGLTSRQCTTGWVITTRLCSLEWHVPRVTCDWIHHGGC